MKRFAMLVIALAVLPLAAPADAQTFSARRMGMGGVVLGGSGMNVAYRAVPAGPQEARTISVPFGIIQVLADPPQLDVGSPDFNVYDLANLLYTAPWNLQLTEPTPLSSDLEITIGQNTLVVDLGDIKNVFPDDHSKIGAVVNTGALGFGIGPVFAGLLPLVEYDNDLSLNDALHGALADAQPFTSNTSYEMFDKARAQAAAGFEVGVALKVLDLSGGGAPAKGEPVDRSGLYFGARAKALRGLAYGDADNTVGFITGDTLFTNPIDIQYTGHLREAGPDGGGWGGGADLGAVWIANGIELGVGVNDIGTQLDWKVRESLVHNDPVSGGYVEDVLNESASFTSRIPAVVTANAAYRIGATTIAADVVSGVNNTQAHLGAETWRGMLALRAGTYLDNEQKLQASLGAGWRFGRIGLDVAVSSHGRNLTLERVYELGAGIAFYH